MKKYIFFGILLLILIILCILVVRTHSNNTIPITNKLYFGISPSETSRLFGEPYDIIPNALDTGKTLYKYRAFIMGQESYIDCYFIQDKNLTSIEFRWEDNLQELYDEVYACLFSYYSNHEDFFLKMYEDTDSKTSRISIGINNGATGLHYDIIRSETFILVNCIDNS